MAVFNPVPVHNFNVFLFDARDDGLLPSSLGEAAGALGGLALGAVKTVLFGSFSEVQGLDQEIETEEYREGGANQGPRRFMKWGRYNSVVLRRGVTFNTDLADWSHQVLNGSRAPIRKNGLILLVDRGGALSGEGTGLNIPVLDTTPVAAWFFRNGLPERLQGPTLNATTNEIAIEALEISHEALMRLGPSMLPGVGDTLSGLGL